MILLILFILLPLSTKFNKGEKTVASKIDLEKCTDCKSCVEVCPVEAITMENEKAKVDEEACVDCGTCVDECPSEAISLDE